jgi:hypothetical protein
MILFIILGARSEDGCGLLYATVNPNHTAGQEPWTVDSVTKAATFFNFVGVFMEGYYFHQSLVECKI